MTFWCHKSFMYLRQLPFIHLALVDYFFEQFWATVTSVSAIVIIPELKFRYVSIASLVSFSVHDVGPILSWLHKVPKRLLWKPWSFLNWCSWTTTWCLNPISSNWAYVAQSSLTIVVLGEDFEWSIKIGVLNWRANIQSGLTHKSGVKTGRVA